jgi:NAD+ kinase
LFRKVGLVARYDKKASLKLTDTLASYLESKGLKVLIEDTLEGKVAAKEEFVPLAKMKADFVISIGGDGTILRTAITLPKPEPPILAVNMGVRGFLTEVEPEGACQAVERILKGDFKVEKCGKLSVWVGEEKLPDALNDVVISGGEPSKVLYSQICIDGKPVLKCQADGIIVATQTGSTGYSLSAGGPVLDRGVDALVITPICSLSVFRSIVVPAEATLTFNVLKPEGMLVMIDGRFRKFVGSNPPAVKVTKSKNATSFIRFETDFYDRLRNRLLFKGTE